MKKWWKDFCLDLFFCAVLVILGGSILFIIMFGLTKVIEKPKPEEKIISVEELKKSCPNIEEKLEEFMGGDISPTEEGKAWLDSICEASK